MLERSMSWAATTGAGCISGTKALTQRPSAIITRMSLADRSFIGALLVDECADYATTVRPGAVSACREGPGGAGRPVVGIPTTRPTPSRVSQGGPVGRGGLGWVAGVGRDGRDEKSAPPEAVGYTIDSGQEAKRKSCLDRKEAV